MDINEFRKTIDSDEGLKSKRKILISLCVILIGLNFSGATLHEANTFIFKLKFTNHENILYLFAISILYLTLRYYGYAKSYHDQLYLFWTKRMLSDYRVFCYTPKEEEINGLLGKRIDIWPGDEPGIQSPNYKIKGIFQRNLTYEATEHDEHDGGYYYQNDIELNTYKDEWGRKDYFKLLSYEAKYQLEALFKYRETLDLLFPYIISFIALSSFFVRSILISST
ncbi:hypothetical protein [Pseudoalteromonas sp. SR44-2]|uniref:hypothetical protein n=1 Tax=Pseudoalteromonas sp. SR44-2 TaxID=2760937 RepID=UPI001601418D|nr:hypothetical protein [Pseudoalteromonas sp. SR44-2]MBB1336596.1 hypothetical protein [Pseudoalteromonas sp. SR44-2]